MSNLVQVLILLGLFVVLLLVIKHRKQQHYEKLNYAKAHGVEMIAGPVDFYGMPLIFQRVGGFCRNLVNVGGEVYIFEYHYTIGGSGVNNVIDMLIDLSCVGDVERTYLSRWTFQAYGEFYPVIKDEYQATDFDKDVFNFVFGNGLSFLYGSWGLIVVPNSGRIRDVDRFKDNLVAVRKILGL